MARRVSKARREMALESGIPKGYEEVPEGEYINRSTNAWYLDPSGGMRKGDLGDIRGGVRYYKKKHPVIIRPKEGSVADA